MKKIIIIFLMSISVMTYAASTLNDSQTLPQLYNVSIVAFKNSENLAKIPASQWLPYQNQDYSNIVQIDYQINTNFMLKQIAKQIKNSRLYTLMLEQAWSQNAMRSDKTKPIFITGGQNYSTDTNTEVWELSGTLKLSKSLYQYLNLYINLSLIAPGTNGLVMLSLKENRRIAVDQLNYIDSPGFGLLIKVEKSKSNIGNLSLNNN